MDIKRVLEPEEDVDARVRGGCSSQKDMLEPDGWSSQKWMVEPEVDAPARIGCHARTRIEKSAKRRRLPRIGPDACILWETHIQSQSCRNLIHESIWYNPPARRNCIHHAKVTHCAQILGLTQVEDREPQQNTKRQTNLEKNSRLLKIKKRKKGKKLLKIFYLLGSQQKNLLPNTNTNTRVYIRSLCRLTTL